MEILRFPPDWPADKVAPYTLMGCRVLREEEDVD